MGCKVLGETLDSQVAGAKEQGWVTAGSWALSATRLKSWGCRWWLQAPGRGRTGGGRACLETQTGQATHVGTLAVAKMEEKVPTKRAAWET